MTVQHVVLFSFPEDLSAEDDAQMRAQVAAWAQQVPELRRLRFGSDLTGARTRGHQYLLLTEFDDLVALEAYRDHPAHQSFLAWITERSCTPLVFDHRLDSTTVLLPEPEATA